MEIKSTLLLFLLGFFIVVLLGGVVLGIFSLIKIWKNYKKTNEMRKLYNVQTKSLSSDMNLDGKVTIIEDSNFVSRIKKNYTINFNVFPISGKSNLRLISNNVSLQKYFPNINLNVNTSPNTSMLQIDNTNISIPSGKESKITCKRNEQKFTCSVNDNIVFEKEISKEIIQKIDTQKKIKLIISDLSGNIKNFQLV